MPKTVITLPCTAQDLESALHAVCDHHGLWNGRIDTMCDGSDSGDACVSIVLSEGPGKLPRHLPPPTSPALANSAALREALEKIRRELNDYCNNGSTLLDRMTEDPPDYTCLRDSLLEIERIVSAALAKPPRNCDVYDGQEAWLEWQHYCAEMDPRTLALRFSAWLLAAATNKKGATDGSN